MKRAALLSVSDTTNLESLARFLAEKGYLLLTTTGTGAYLKSHGIQSTMIEDYTGQKEILGGRVKTLHPKIHAGILAKRDSDKDLNDLASIDAIPIDVVVVTLYPFREKVKAKKDFTHRELIELIDIGGNSLLRASAKNSEFVLVVGDPDEYELCAEALMKAGSVEKLDPMFRHARAVSAFTVLAEDTLEIAKTLSRRIPHGAPLEGEVLRELQPLRYGENPHQQAGFYRSVSDLDSLPWKIHQGKELSYNNLIDLDAAFAFIKPFKESGPTAVIIKHTNPCGVGTGDSLLEAIQRAKQCDPRSHFGGIVVSNISFSLDAAEEVAGEFAEIVVAPSFSDEAMQRFSRNKNLRVISYSSQALESSKECRSAAFGMLFQQKDPGSSAVEAQVVSKKIPSAEEIRELEFAWKICSGVKSNAIVLVKNGMAIGVGAGQMSRIDSVELALKKANQHGHDVHGAWAASDAFFPFPDSVESLAKAGIKGIITPHGAKRDPDSIKAADEAGIVLLFASHRHFRH